MGLADLLQQAKQPEDQQRMIRRITAQAEISKVISGATTLDELLRRVADARELVEAQQLVLYAIEDGALTARADGDGDKAPPQAVSIPLDGNSIPALVARTGDTVTVADITDPMELMRHKIAYDAKLFGPLHRGLRAHSIMAAPVFNQGKTLGVLEAVNKTSGTPFDFLDLECLTEAAKSLGALLAQTLAFQEQKDKLAYTEQLNRIINRIHAARDIDTILLSVCHDVIKVFDAQRITIYAVDKETEELYSKVKDGDEVREIRVPIDFTSIAGYVAAARETVNIQDVYDDKALVRIHHELGFNRTFDQKTGFRTRQVLAAPILFEGELLGVLQLINTNSGEPFGADLTEALQSITETLGIAMNNRKASARPSRRSKLDLLLENGTLDEEKLDKAREIAREEGNALEDVLMTEFKVPKSALLESYGVYYRREPIEYSPELPIPVGLIDKLENQAENLKFARWCPVREEEDGRVVVAIDDPRDVMRIDNIRVHFQGHRIDFRVALQDDIARMIDHFFGTGESGLEAVDLDEVIQNIDVGEESASDSEEPTEDDSGICRLVNQIIVQGYQKGASDIHIEPYIEGEVEVRYRIDGDLMMAMKLPTKLRNAIVSRIKIMSELDIAERRKPQDGKIKFRKWGPLDIELRVATVPTVGGLEDVVMRILASSKPIPLDKMGMSERNYNEFISSIDQPYGIVLCVGPTGSGKTTTLHSALGFINDVETKIWTAEDPVEITQKGLRQVQVNRKAGMDFAAIMRSFLRADPDVIMVGEMRDLETTSTGIEASLTGHLVFSTLHTNNAPETVTRLLDMGIDEFSFADALLCVLAQRLGRTLCKECKEEYAATQGEYDILRREYGRDDLWEALGKPFGPDLKLMRRRDGGCSKCNGTGMRGRCGIHELLVNSAEIKDFIYRRAKAEEIRDKAIEEGMRTLKQDGIEKVLSGLTIIEKVREVCSA